jgi:hypothetical protein
LLTAVSQIIENGGLPLQNMTKPSKGGWRQNRGFKRGLLIFLLTFLIVPILTILTIAANEKPFLVVIATILFGLGGLIKMAWALLFESDKAIDNTSKNNYIPAANNFEALPEMRETPANAYVSPAGTWRDTNDLEPRGSVTDPTTKFLVNEPKDQ